MPMEHVRVIVEIRVGPGLGHLQEEAFRTLAPLVRAEPGCVRYELFPVIGEKDRYVILEEWSSQAALDAHDVAPHMVSAAAGNSAFRAGPARVLFLPGTGIR